MSRRVSVGNLAEAVMKELREFADTTTEGMKAAVTDVGKQVRDEIKAGAPAASGKYAKSWAVKNTQENSHALEVTVHSRNRYQLAHLLEHGHAKRNGGRTRAIPHIAPAEQAGIEQLQSLIEKRQTAHWQKACPIR